MLAQREINKQWCQLGLFDAVQIRIANIVKELNRDEEPMHKQAYISVIEDKIVIE